MKLNQDRVWFLFAPKKSIRTHTVIVTCQLSPAHSLKLITNFFCLIFNSKTQQLIWAVYELILFTQSFIFIHFLFHFYLFLLVLLVLLSQMYLKSHIKFFFGKFLFLARRQVPRIKFSLSTWLIRKCHRDYSAVNFVMWLSNENKYLRN